ncbi:MAG: nickel pincer cofactor biosynthesis protein LarB [Thermodesulfobacteriota bacterium]|nr:nickel pincer cofactor biosynthesis protein LarB [Thermodesulfobacteriota bacterium]
MDEKKLTQILNRFRQGRCDVADVVQQLKHWPAEHLDFACLDHQRSLRTGFPEVIYGENKSAEQMKTIFKSMMKKTGVVMATRVSSEKAEGVRREIPDLIYHEQARMLVANPVKQDEKKGRGVIVVLAAGTSDIPVADEARVTASSMGHRVEVAYDVGVAGIHRLFSQMELLGRASVIVVVAGMEGALPSVVAGLVDKPVIAVPTSVGYGASFGGLAALLGMLNSCAPGVAVVNIDNGFGAGCMAAAIDRI